MAGALPHSNGEQRPEPLKDIIVSNMDSSNMSTWQVVFYDLAAGSRASVVLATWKRFGQVPERQVLRASARSAAVEPGPYTLFSTMAERSGQYAGHLVTQTSGRLINRRVEMGQAVRP